MEIFTIAIMPLWEVFVSCILVPPPHTLHIPYSVVFVSYSLIPLSPKYVLTLFSLFTNGLLQSYYNIILTISITPFLFTWKQLIIIWQNMESVTALTSRTVLQPLQSSNGPGWLDIRTWHYLPLGSLILIPMPLQPQGQSIINLPYLSLTSVEMIKLVLLKSETDVVCLLTTVYYVAEAYSV